MLLHRLGMVPTELFVAVHMDKAKRDTCKKRLRAAYSVSRMHKRALPGARSSDDAQDSHEGIPQRPSECFMVLLRQDAKPIHGALPHIVVLVFAACQELRHGIAHVLRRPCAPTLLAFPLTKALPGAGGTAQQ